MCVNSCIKYSYIFSCFLMEKSITMILIKSNNNNILFNFSGLIQLNLIAVKRNK